MTNLELAKNYIQSAIFQIQNGNSALAIDLLREAKRLIDKAQQRD
jgi:ribosomal protein S20